MSAEEELQGGIKNALERGVSLEDIIRTFINAGYQESAVHAAARIVTEGATTIVSQNKNSIPQANQSTSNFLGSSQPAVQNKFSFPSPPMNVPLEQQNLKYQNKPENSNKTKIVLLVSVLFVLLITLIASLFFREQIVNLLG